MDCKYWLSMMIMITVAGCSSSPSDADIETAIAKTAQAIIEPARTKIVITATPSHTPKPTNTPLPTHTPTPSSTPTPLPEVFINQLRTFLDNASAVSGATTTGVSYVDLRRLVSDARGSYDLLLALWPQGILVDAIDNFGSALEGWDNTLYLWSLDINDKDNPVAPNINGFVNLQVYAGEFLVVEIHPESYIVPDYRGEEFLPFDENVRILMSVAAAYYEEGASEALTLLGN